MRIVAGSARSRRIETVPGRDVRPTTDRVREAVFNVVYSEGGVEGRSVLDLFAGSGALGLEALSRGAASVVFVEHDRRARAVLARNIASLGFGDRVEVIASDALDFLRQQAAESAPGFDLAFLDPPYAFDGWSRLLSEVEASLLVIESDRHIDVGPSWVSVKERRYSGTVVTFARRPELERP